MSARGVSEKGRQSIGHIPSLDGLRGAAILLVMAHHVALRWPQATEPGTAFLRYGWIGVDIFFALSGFLITGTLLTGPDGMAGLRTFYWKRALRIWPLYYGSLLVVCLYAIAVHQHYPWAISLVFLQNFLPEWPVVGFEQTWSLCIEEHFYLVWPLLVLFTRRSLLPWVLGVVLVISPILRIWAVDHGVSLKLLYSSTQYRLDSIAFGSLLALVDWGATAVRWRLARLGIVVSLAAIPAVVISLRTDWQNLGQGSVWGYSFLALLSAGLIAALLQPGRNVLQRILEWKPLRYVGQISYGLYMIHPFLLMNVGRLNLHAAWIEIPVAVLLSFAAAAASYQWFERPILGLRHKLAKRKADDSVASRVLVAQ
jgi:peptidoglycan/LPS O-acetylase OafA/YrhL